PAQRPVNTLEQLEALIAVDGAWVERAAACPVLRRGSALAVAAPRHRNDSPLLPRTDGWSGAGRHRRRRRRRGRPARGERSLPFLRPHLDDGLLPESARLAADRPPRLPAACR